jgi:hydroxyacylglutathione hydrolase
MPNETIIIPVTPLQQNCSLLCCEQTQHAAIIDPGGDANKIIAAVDEAGVVVEKLLLTHGHFDHAGAAAELSEYWNVPIEGPHQADKFLTDTIPEWGTQFNVPLGRACNPNRWLNHNDTVTFGEQSLEVFHCPGHTPGHVVFYHQEGQMVLVGDVIFKGAIGRTDFPGGSHPALIQSIRNHILSLDDAVMIVPGHGMNTTVGAERRGNPFLN